MFKLLTLPAAFSLMGVGLYAALAPASLAADGPALYRITQSIVLGAPERWDYLAFEGDSNRVYVAHSDRIDVIDVSSGKIVGHVAVDGANGVALVPAIGKGYAGSRATQSAVVFDLKTFKVIKTLPAAEDTDAIRCPHDGG